MEPTATPPEKDPDAVGAGIDFTDPQGPLAPYYLQASKVLLVLLLAAIFIVVGQIPLWHTDIWGHMKFGQWMVEHGSLPTHEPFCDLADQAALYVNFQWLSQLLFYLVYQLGATLAGGDSLQQIAGGVAMLRTLHAALTVLRLGLLAGAIWRASGSGYLAIAGVLLSAALALANISVLRPQIVGEVYLAALLFIVSAPELSWRGVIAIPILMALWANSHGSYPVGLMVVGACTAGSLVSWLWVRRNPPWRLLLTTLLAGFAVLAHPHGPWLLMHTLALSQHPNIADMDEWKRITYDSPWGIAFAVSLGLIAVTQLLRLLPAIGDQQAPLTASSPGRLFPLTHWLLLIGFGVQTYMHQRMMPWWVLLVPWILAPHWAVILRRYPKLVKDSSVPSFRKTIIAVLLAWVGLMWSPVSIWLFEGQPRPLARSVHSGTPWQLAEELRAPSGAHLPQLAEWLKKNYRDGKFTGRIFTSETQGDYLLWALAPEVRLFMYTHVHLFPAGIWQDCQHVKAGAADWEQILNDRDVKIIIVESELHPALRRRLLDAQDRWTILVDETSSTAKTDRRGRVLIAVRNTP